MSPPAERPSTIGLDELESRIRDGSIDTVVSAITDLQGRLMGKRVTGDFFLDHAKGGIIQILKEWSRAFVVFVFYSPSAEIVTLANLRLPTCTTIV